MHYFVSSATGKRSNLQNPCNCSLNLYQTNDWSMSTENIEFSSVKLWTVMKFLSLHNRNSKGNPQVNNANIGWHIPVIFTCKEMVYHLPGLTFWGPISSAGRPSIVSIPEIVDPDLFLSNQQILSKRITELRNIHRIHWVYNPQAVGYEGFASQLCARMFAERIQSWLSVIWC